MIPEYVFNRMTRDELREYADYLEMVRIDYDALIATQSSYTSRLLGMLEQHAELVAERVALANTQRKVDEFARQMEEKYKEDDKE